ncbi:MAG: DNA gyrase inhibitor YacG [Bdellovibrionales bacterium]|nr:DNA gyrase inhibitor YacG [Bdellovibrionales bacterium]
MKTALVKCPHCKTMHTYDLESSFRPFCSERCKLLDLGAWAEMSYRIPTNEAPSDEDLMEALKEDKE